MPYKLKTSARKGRRNKRIAIVVGVALLVLFIVLGAFYATGQFNGPVPQYSLLVNVEGSGSTNSTGPQTYKSGTVVGVQASASADWVLNDWLLGGVSVGSTNPYAVAVTKDTNLTAEFKQLPTQDKVLLETSMGNITIMLRDDKPNTAGNFKNLVFEGKYDNTIFHRVISGFMIQGGDPTGTGSGDPSIATIPDEIGSNNSNVLGTVAMANTGQPNSASSQFFINTVDNGNNVIDNARTKFDAKYTVFGYVIDGMDVAQAISHVSTDSNDKPVQNVTLIKAILLPA
jgi:cyclophilin family peptidyl-prolyl cis-trans isomerase